MEKRSLFYPLDQEGLTTLRIQYDWKTGNVFCRHQKTGTKILTGPAITMIFMWKASKPELPNCSMM